MKKLYKIPGGPGYEGINTVVETSMRQWVDAGGIYTSLIACWIPGQICIPFPVRRHQLFDITPIWQPPLEFRPPWAKWAAFDEDGLAVWRECEPRCKDAGWWLSSAGSRMDIGYVHESIRPRWRESLVELPEAE